MPDIRPQIFAFSGVLNRQPGERGTSALVDYALSLTGTTEPARMCYIPTAVGDAQQAVDGCTKAYAGRADISLSILRLFTQPNVPDVREHLLGQDVILVEGGSVVNLMAVWRAHGLDQILRDCWAAGVVLTGTSAGSICWHRGGPTDSFGDSLAPFTDGLGLVPFSNGVHDDLADQPRRQIYRELVAKGELAAGYATEDGVGLHYVGTGLHEAVSVSPGQRAWRVAPDGQGGYTEQKISPRLI